MSAVQVRNSKGATVLYQVRNSKGGIGVLPWSVVLVLLQVPGAGVLYYYRL